MVKSEAGGGIRAVSRAVAVLSCFSAAKPTRTVVELVRSTGLPRTTVLRLIETLEAEGMLEVDSTGIVRPGAGLIGWATLAGDVWRVPDPAVECMRSIAETVGETVSLYVRSSLHRRVIAQAQPVANRLRHVVEVGDTLPLWGGAAAMVLLAQEESEQRDELIGAVSADPASPFDAAELSAQVERARVEGFAVSHGLRERGNSGVAVPLLDAAGARLPLAAALAIGGPTDRFDDDSVRRFRRVLEEGASAVRLAGLPLALR